MKKLILLAVITVVFSATNTFAQSYKTAAGLGLDFGDGATLVGPSVKHFMNNHGALQGDLLFGAGGTWLGAWYQYHAPIQGAGGLQWYLGLGPQLGFGGGSTLFYIRPAAGLDYKISSAPLSLTFDWRPAFRVTNPSGFEAARFGLGVRFSFN